MSRDDTWRDMPDRGFARHRAGIANVKPLATNGVLVLVQHPDGRMLVYQLSNLDFEEVRITVRPRREPKPRPAPKSNTVISIADLL